MCVSGPAETQIFNLRSVEGAKGGMMWSKCCILRTGPSPLLLPLSHPLHLPVKVPVMIKKGEKKKEKGK